MHTFFLFHKAFITGSTLQEYSILTSIGIGILDNSVNPSNNLMMSRNARSLIHSMLTISHSCLSTLREERTTPPPPLLGPPMNR
jgi:hypothetical protein